MSVSKEIAESEPQLFEAEQPSARQKPMSPRWSVRMGHANLGHYLEIPLMHKRLVLGCFIASLFLGWLGLLFWPRKYESESKLVVKVGRESVSLDPTATTSQTLMLQKTQEEEINSALEVLSSRQVAEQTVESLGAGNVIEGVLPEVSGGEASALQDVVEAVTGYAKGAAFVVLYALGIKDDISDRELAVREVQGSVDIFAPKKSTVITVHAESKTPEMAQAIARQVVDGFLDQHRRVSQTEGSREFFLQQSNTVEQEVQAWMKKRSSFMKERNIVSIDANRALLKEQLTSLDRDSASAKEEYEKAQAESKDILEKLSSTDDEIVASRLGGSDMTWSGMRQKVYELEIQEKRYSSLYTDEHELLVQTREQLEGAREILGKMQSERTDSSTTPNPAKKRMEEELQKQQTKMVGLESALGEIQRQRSVTEAGISELLEFERLMVEMDREISIKEGSLRLLRSKLEEARVIEALQQQHISNISVFQPATFVERPVSPQKKLLVAGFAFLGLCTGLGLAFLKNISNSRLRSPGDIENQLDVPVIAVVPESRKLSHSRQAVFRDKQINHAVRRLVSDILLGHASVSGRAYTLGVVSVGEGAGSTTLASQLALVSSDECDLKTIIVDADSRRRSLSKSFGLNGAPGLIELVSGDASHDECLQQGNRSKLGIIACSSMHNDTRMQNRPGELAAALSAYRGSCDLLVVDLPPADQPDHATGLAAHLDGLLLVVESEETEAVEAERVVNRLLATEANLLGVVLNKQRRYLPKAFQSIFRADV
ncbi:MAG: GumC family protein [Pirellulaceae bacterium]